MPKFTAPLLTSSNPFCIPSLVLLQALEKEAAALEARQAAAEREAGGSLEEFCKQRDRETKEVGR
jgi:hypothetical protein